MRFSQKAQSAYNYKMLLRYTLCTDAPHSTVRSLLHGAQRTHGAHRNHGPLVSLSKTLNHNCFVLQMGRKAVGPVCCVMHVQEPRTLIVIEKGLAPVFLDSRLEHPAVWICARYKSFVLLLLTPSKWHISLSGNIKDLVINSTGKECRNQLPLVLKVEACVFSRWQNGQHLTGCALHLLLKISQNIVSNLHLTTLSSL